MIRALTTPSSAAAGTAGLACVTGLVEVRPTHGVGAILGRVVQKDGTAIPVRQVVGPAGGPVSLNSVNGTVATVCGRFRREHGQIILDVQEVRPGTPAPGPDNVLLILILVLALTLLR